jgi:hypothetical protein
MRECGMEPPMTQMNADFQRGPETSANHWRSDGR